MIFFILTILSVCAVAKPQGPRIIGGLPASEGQFPYLAQIKFIKPELQTKYAVTGSIISNQWILTSASLIKGFKPEKLMVVVGTIYLDNHSGWAYAVSDFIEHPKFNTEGMDYNIGLIKVKGKIILSENVETIKLSSSIRIPPNLSLNFAAWGITNLSTPDYARTLQHITLKSITMEECRQYLSQHSFDNYSFYFCTESLGGSGPCYSDSGAPLVYGNYQLGFDVSGTSCPLKSPSIFINVAAHRDWIKELTGV